MKKSKEERRKIQERELYNLKLKHFLKNTHAYHGYSCLIISQRPVSYSDEITSPRTLSMHIKKVNELKYRTLEDFDENKSYNTVTDYTIEKKILQLAGVDD